MTDEPMDVEKVVEGLNAALPMQMRSALHFTWIAGTATGLEWQAVATKMESFGVEELEDVRHIIEKITALGGRPTAEVKAFDAVPLSNDGIERLIKNENATLEALRKVIPATGQEARSEALEHLLEHIIMRKQHQVDYLTRLL